MYKNYLKIAFRNLAKNKVLSFINIVGLAVGIACTLVIVLFIQDELSFDKYNNNPERIHRVVKDFVNDDGTKLPDATTPPALAPLLQSEIPEVEHVVRIFPNWGTKYLVKYQDKNFYEEGVYRADSSIFKVFNFPFVKGNANDAFKEIKSVVFTETAAKKYFGIDDPIGITVEISPMGPHTVTAVIKDVPANSHFTFDFLISTRTIGGNIDQSWGFYNFYTYIKLKPNTSIATVEPKIVSLFKKNQPENTNIFYTQPLTDIHLKSNLRWELKPNSDTTYIYVFATIALFLIVIASINYINLVTAKSALRAKEVGVRKVVGAERSSLVRQFLIESVLTVFLASILATAIGSIILPAFNNITQKSLSIFSSDNSLVLFVIIGFTLLTGLLAGLYPAFYLSRFNPSIVLKGVANQGRKTINLRKALVVLQFVISVVLIVGSLVINTQLNYMQSANLGFNKEQVVVLNNIRRSPAVEGLKAELKNIPGVKYLTTADGMIGGQNWTNGFSRRGSDEEQLVNFLSVGYDFLETMGLKLKEGRGFSAKYPGDTLLNNGIPGGPFHQVIGSIIINEKAVMDLSLPTPSVGQQLVYGRDADTTYYVNIVGVVKDFHFTSLRNEIKPFAFLLNHNRMSSMAVKIDSKDINATLSKMQNKWQAQFPEQPFDYYFLDENIDKLYRAEQNFKSLFSYFTIIALIIACLGLFGLAAFTAEQRVKEIGIRKVLGASVTSVIGLLSKDFLKLVVIALVVAIPIAWYAMNKWLQDFSYRIDIGWWVFVVAGVLAILIALITVSFQAIRSAMANPVKNLRTE